MIAMRARLVDLTAVTLLVLGSVVGLVVAPPDRLQGDLQRLMYIHVPTAWVAYLAFAVTLVCSVAWLRTRREDWDHRAHAAVEVGVVFTAVTLALGSIWGKPVWGVWWTWDARLITTALLLLVYLGYLALRRATDDPTVRARRAAVWGIVAFVQVPIVHMSVVWWRTLHQPPSVLRPGAPAIGGTMLLALLLNVAAFTAVFAAIARRRTELARAEAELVHHTRTRAPLAEQGISAPAATPITPDAGGRA